MVTVFTIGHSNHAIGYLIDLLCKHEITAVADVRSRPYSRQNPQFNQDSLKSSLNEHGIKYVFLGRELGARSQDPSCYVNGRVQYSRLANTELFQDGLRRVMTGAEAYRLAILCAEKEPLGCHRSLLVGHELVKRGVEVVHIHSDGRLELHADAMSRLLVMLGMSDTDLFKSKSDLIDEACALQEERIAYVEEPTPGADSR